MSCTSWLLISHRSKGHGNLTIIDKYNFLHNILNYLVCILSRFSWQICLVFHSSHCRDAFVIFNQNIVCSSTVDRNNYNVVRNQLMIKSVVLLGSQIISGVRLLDEFLNLRYSMSQMTISSYNKKGQCRRWHTAKYSIMQFFNWTAIDLDL